MWPFPMLRNYATDAMLTELFLSFARTKFSIVKNGTYELHLRGPMGEIKCWNSNRWYAWAHEGTFTPTDAKEAAILWKYRMPSRAAVRKMRQAVEAVEVARFRAAERGEIVLNLDDYREVGYAVKRPTPQQIAAAGEKALRAVPPCPSCGMHVGHLSACTAGVKACATEQDCEWQPWCRMHGNCRKKVEADRTAKYVAGVAVDRHQTK